MEIVEVTFKEYKNHFQQVYHIFASADFNELNADKCEEIFYLIFKDKKVRLGIIGGIKENSFYSPFSAPFGGFSFIKQDIRLQYLEEAIFLLEEWSKSKKLKGIHITLPPFIYNESFISKMTNSFFLKGYKTKHLDLNYSFELKNLNSDYASLLWRNARKNLNRSLKQDFIFKICKSTEEKSAAYKVILRNREAKGFPLRMTWEQVQKTTELIPADFFLLYNDGEKIASAMVFHISPQIVQVVYWGDLPEYSYLKTMNYLSFKIFEYYKSTEIEIVDIGPSTENSIPNYGLCEFKESIGCDISTKLTFSKSFK